MSSEFTAHNCDHFKDGDEVPTTEVTINKDTGAVYHSECDGYIGQVEDFNNDDPSNKTS